MTISAADDRARGAGVSERRPITVLFADIAGSTSIAERLDPEDWTTLVGEAFQRMNRTIERYGGNIARLMGDGVLAFFGAPTAHEDDPERAVRCGLDLVRAIDELDTSNHISEADKLRVRVGINTGPVVVGIVGTETASEYTAMGDTVNVAARMQASARPGSVLVTAATHRFVATLVDAVDVGLLELKGKTDAVHAYEITGLKRGAVQTRGLAGFHSPLIGRDTELGRLEQAFDVARAGQGRVATVLGEPGMGKSRLLAELRGRVELKHPSARWVEGRCLSYGEAMPYHLVLDLVRSLIGVTAGADESQVADALQSRLPALFILSSRAERASPGWRLVAAARDVFGDALTEVRLEPLSMDASRELVSNLLTIESLPADTRDLILARAEGNPFFVEEVIRMLIDRGAIVREGDRWVATDRVAGVEIPDTLHGLLLARIDRLPAESPRALRVASVIGRQFGVTILESLLRSKTQ